MKLRFDDIKTWLVGAGGVLTAAATLVLAYGGLNKAMCSTFSILCLQTAQAPSPPPVTSARQFNLQFTVAFAEPDNELYLKDAIYIGEKLRGSQSNYVTVDPRLSVPPESVYVWPNVLVPSRDRPYRALLHRIVSNGYKEAPKGTEVCLVNGSSPPENASLYAALECSEATGVCRKRQNDQGWVEFCPTGGAYLTLPGLISSAHAAEPSGTVWSVPSLDTLQKRTDLGGTGYTKFTITGPKLSGNPDGVVLVLKVNGTSVRIDGVDPEYHVLPYDPSKGVDVQFALQNLDFAGVNGGCDIIEASLRPVSKGEFAGPAAVLKRSYVALRDLEPAAPMPISEREFTWKGTYIRPPVEYDNEVLVNSFDGKDIASKAQMDSARRLVNKAKKDLDALNLTFKEMRVVGVIRPPLTTAAFGLALGIVTSTGQVQFTFPYPTAKEFLDAVKREGAANTKVFRVVRKNRLVPLCLQQGYAIPTGHLLAGRMISAPEVVVIFGAAVRADGTPSGALQRRIEAAVYYACGRSVTFLVSGGVGRYPPAEATVMADMLRARRIPGGAIIQDTQSKTTGDTIVNCTPIIRALGGEMRVMVCSDAYHLPRCRWLFRLNGLKAGGIAAADGRRANSPQKWLWFHLREIPAIVKDTVVILARRIAAAATRAVSS